MYICQFATLADAKNPSAPIKNENKNICTKKQTLWIPAENISILHTSNNFIADQFFRILI